MNSLLAPSQSAVCDHQGKLVPVPQEIEIHEPCSYS
jgi:hypothetical protein